MYEDFAAEIGASSKPSTELVKSHSGEAWAEALRPTVGDGHEKLRRTPVQACRGS